MDISPSIQIMTEYTAMFPFFAFLRYQTPLECPCFAFPRWGRESYICCCRTSGLWRDCITKHCHGMDSCRIARNCLFLICFWYCHSRKVPTAFLGAFNLMRCSLHRCSVKLHTLYFLYVVQPRLRSPKCTASDCSKMCILIDYIRVWKSEIVRRWIIWFNFPR